MKNIDDEVKKICSIFRKKFGFEKKDKSLILSLKEKSKFFTSYLKNKSKTTSSYLKDKIDIELLLKNKFINCILNTFKIIFAIIFTPLFLIFSLFEMEIFLRVLKQIIAITYFLLFIIFVYTLFNQNKPIGKNEIVVVNIHFKDKIRDF